MVTTPVYRGSFTGHFKHLFDLIGQDTLVDTPALLAATGGGERHALGTRPPAAPAVQLPAGFGPALIGVFASRAELADYQVSSDALAARIRLAAERAVPLFGAHHRIA